MEIPLVDSSSTGESGASLPVQTLGKEAFLQMLVTQLKYQDPLDPMDNTAFVAQLAEFSALEQMQNMNGILQSTMALTRSLNHTLVTELIGRTVKALGDGVYLPSSEDVDLLYGLYQDAAEVTIQILNAAGEVIRTLEVGPQSAGEHVVQWDGRDATGAPVESGVYTYALRAVEAGGQEVPRITYSGGRVTGVRYGEEGDVRVLIGDLEILLGNVVEVIT